MTKRKRDSRFIEEAREEAQGTEVQEGVSQGFALEHEREEAQGVDVFEDPDATLPAGALREGAPGHESLTEDALDRAGADEEDPIDRRDD